MVNDPPPRAHRHPTSPALWQPSLAWTLRLHLSDLAVDRLQVAEDAGGDLGAGGVLLGEAPSGEALRLQ